MKRDTVLMGKREQQNHSILVKRLVAYLENHVVQVHNKLENETFLISSPLDYYATMLDTYYMFPIISDDVSNLDEHFQELLSYFNFEDEELCITLVPGHTKISPKLVKFINIPNTFYREDEKIFDH